jgi:hypothetical protein
MTDDMTLKAELLAFTGFVRELWARQVAMTQESPERTEELRQMLIDGMAAVEQTTDMERMRAALDAFDAAPAAAPVWDLIEMPTGQPNVRRLRIPGGWLYQVELDERVYSEASDGPGPDYTREGWHPPVFVPFAGDGRLP